MERRSFLGSFLGVGAFLGLGALPRVCAGDDVDRLCDALEAYARRGMPTFRLYGHQRRMARQIVENDRVVFVKAQQTGMTTLLNLIRDFCSQDSVGTPKQRAMFGGMIAFDEPSKEITSAPATHTVETKSVHIVEMKGARPSGPKVVIAGSVSEGMRLVVDRAEGLGFKVFRYPIHECSEHMDMERIRAAYSAIPRVHWEREMECRFV